MKGKPGDTIRITKPSDFYCCHALPVGCEVTVFDIDPALGRYMVVSDSAPVIEGATPSIFRFVSHRYCEIIEKAESPAKLELSNKNKTFNTMEFKVTIGATPEVIEVLSAIAAALAGLTNTGLSTSVTQPGAPERDEQGNVVTSRKRRTKAEIEAEKAAQQTSGANDQPAETKPTEADPFADEKTSPAPVASAAPAEEDPFAPKAVAPAQVFTPEQIRAKAGAKALADNAKHRDAVVSLMKTKYGVSAATDIPVERAQEFFNDLDAIN